MTGHVCITEKVKLAIALKILVFPPLFEKFSIQTEVQKFSRDRGTELERKMMRDECLLSQHQKILSINKPKRGENRFESIELSSLTRLQEKLPQSYTV